MDIFKKIKYSLETINHSIRKQLYILVWIVTVLFLVISSGEVCYFVYQNEYDAWKGQLIDTALMTSRSINLYLQQTTDTLDILAAFGGDELRANPDLLSGLIGPNSNYREIVYLDLDGNVIWDTPAKIPILSNYNIIRNGGWFEEAASGKVYYSDVNFSTDVVPYIIVARPTIHGGVIAARMDMSILSDVVKQVELGNSGRVFIATQDGHIIAHTDPKVMIRNLNLWSIPQMRDLLQNPQGVWLGIYNDYQNEKVLGAREPVLGTTWQVVAVDPVSEAFARTRTALIVVLLAWIFILIAILSYLQHRINIILFQPLELLREGVRSFGEGNFDFRIHLPKQIEIAQVADAFNLMANQLQGHNHELEIQRIRLQKEILERQDTEDELISLNQTLEARVEDRTRELSILNGQLRQLSGKYTSLVEHIPAVTYEAKIGRAHDATFISPQIEQLTGFSAEEWLSDKGLWQKQIHSEDKSRVSAEYENCQTFDKPFQVEYRLYHKDGGLIWVRDQAVFIRNEEGVPLYIQGVIMDITGSKQAEDQLVYSAFHDMLTNLPNRALFMDHLKTSVTRGHRTPDYHFSVLFIDLDNFKLVNDTLGHSAGDRLLILVANAISSCLRSGDTVARIGGDEFVILLDDIQSETDVLLIVDRIIFEVKRPFNIDGQDIFTSPSVGVVVNPAEYDNPQDILRDADVAMYRAKALGKSRYVIFDSSLQVNTVSMLELEGEMRQAVERAEFMLLYQPIVDLHSDRITGFEALLRWNHPERGLLTPVDFMSIAEDSGMIVPIGFWVIREACRQCVEWQNEYQSDPPLTMNVNLSSKQFLTPDLADGIVQILQGTGLRPDALGLEIMEDVFISLGKGVIPILTRLKSTGIRLQIDDFGKGYSTFTYLPQFPINTIKIGRNYINRMMCNGSKDVIQAMIHLAKDLGMTAVAEGIETEEQLAHLRDINCPLGQGFYLARPLGKQKAAEVLHIGHLAIAN